MIDRLVLPTVVVITRVDVTWHATQAEMELAVAKPALMAAHEAVNCLDKASLTELKSFSKV